MIKIAKDVGAGLAKFQLYDAEDDKGKPHYQWVKAHELTFEDATMLFDYGASIGMEVFFSVFAPRYVEWCERIGVKRYKIAAGMRDLDTVTAIIRMGKPTIVSAKSQTHTMGAGWIVKHLFAPAGYPQNVQGMPDFEDDNMGTVYDGFSDHTIGLDAAKIAIARGASIVEKHFCLSHDSRFPDDAWSMTPDELAELVRWEKVCQEVL